MPVPPNDLIRVIRIPLLLSVAILLAYWLFEKFKIDQSSLGVVPLNWRHWTGILSAPLAHGSPAHLFGNVTTLFLVSTLVYLFYRHIAGRVHVLLWLMTGLLMFLIARPGVSHIGASGVVYALLSFLIIAGWFSKSRSRRVVSLALIMYYGGMIWGLFPLDQRVSWDGHLAGAVSGALAALFWMKRIRNEYGDAQPSWNSEEDRREDPYAPFDET